jgi:hypothetical protein
MAGLPTGRPTMVYQGDDPEAWCPSCLAHWAVTVNVFHLSGAGVTSLGVWLRCFICGYWDEL